MSALKFDEFFYNGRLVALRDALDNTHTDLMEHYDKDRLYCPECHIAQLTFTHRTTRKSAYLSTRHSVAEHANNCSYAVASASKRQVKSYYAGLTNEQIQDKLDAAINLYLRHINGENNHEPLPPRNQNPGILTTVENGHQTHRRLPKRNIYSIYNVTDDELGIPLLVYGCVKIEAIETPSKFKEGETYHKFHIVSIRTGSVIRRFNIRQLPAPVDPNLEYYLTMIVIASRDKDGVIGYELYCKNPLSIKYILAC